MVSLRRRRLLGLPSGKDYFVSPLPLYCENLNASTSSPQLAESEGKYPMLSNDASITNMVDNLPNISLQSSLKWRAISNTIKKEEPGPSNVSASSSSKDQPIQQNKEEPGSSNVFASSSSKDEPSQKFMGWLFKDQPSQKIIGPPVKHRKQHRRKDIPNREPCVMRGVYFKNMKWQAAIKVDKKQIHLGTVDTQEEAARLYDRAAFLCGRETNFQLSDELKQELLKFTWDEFLAMTQREITAKKLKGKLDVASHSQSEPPPLQNVDFDNKEGLNGSSTSEDAEEETLVS